MDFDLLQFISVLGLGSLLTVIVRSIFNAIGSKQNWKRNIAKVIILKQIEASENAVKYLQTLEDALYGVKLACANRHKLTESSLILLQNANDTFGKELPSMQTNMAVMGMYYDFKSVDAKYDIYAELDKFQYEVSKISAHYCHVIADDSSEMTIEMGDNIKIDDVLVNIAKTTSTIIQYIEEIQKVIRDSINGLYK